MFNVSVIIFFCVVFILLDWLILVGKEFKRNGNLLNENFLYWVWYFDLYVNNKNLELFFF